MPLFLRPVDPARAMLALPARAGWAAGTPFPAPVGAPLGIWSCAESCSLKT